MSGAKAKKQVEKPQQEDVFQAVLLADNFENYIFGEKCPYLPEGQIKLANRKLVDYSLEALTASGVNEIFVYSTRNSAELKEHIEQSKWSNLPNTIKVITSEDSFSLGDALRDLDAKSMLRNDFILMESGVITNIPLRPLLDKHRETVKSDKGAVMTLVHRKMSPGHRSKSNNNNPVVVVDSKTNKIVAYNFKLTGKKLTVPLENMKPEMELYFDTCSSGIMICSSSVPPLFTDNFDFANIDDFIRGILINEEIMGNSLYLNRIEKGYANRVVDFHTYQGISLDALQRWTYPLVPDMPFGAGFINATYPFNYNFTYKGSNIKIGQGAEVGPLVLIGHNSEVGTNSSIVNSCLGDKCKVGVNVKIAHSFIGDNVIIGDDCEIHECIIADGTTVARGTELKPWVLVDGKSQVRIELPCDPCDRDDDESSDEELHVVGNSENEASDPEKDDDVDFKMFSTEVVDSLLRGFQENVATENLVLEINSSKFAYNVTMKDITVALTKGVLALSIKLHPDFHDSFPLKLQWDKTQEAILKFKDLFEHYTTTVEAQLNLLAAIEEYANDYVYFRPMLMRSLKLLYDEEILTEGAILDWHKNESLYEAGNELRTLVKPFVEWLKTAESEDDDDE